MYEYISETNVPEPLPKEVLKHLDHANNILMVSGADELIKLDRLTRGAAILALADHDGGIYGNNSEAARLLLLDQDLFIDSKLPLTVHHESNSDLLLVNLVKVDDFGQIYRNYTVNLFICKTGETLRF